MSLVMEEFKPSVSTLEEVKKLQDLVRKLEIQNLHLRNKQSSNRRGSNSPVKEHRASNSSRSSTKDTDEKTSSDSNSFINKYSIRDEDFDDLEIIRVSDIEMSDDESWLYSSPSSKANDKKESPYAWLRKDVDDPENKQLQLTKKALITKLNELEILSPSSKLHSHQLGNNTVTNLQRSPGYYKTQFSVQNYDSGAIDTRTFTRSKKKEALDFLQKLELINSGRSLEKIHPVETLNRRGSDVSIDSLPTCQDANDVQEAARMQEESLRMSSPMSKRGSFRSSARKISSSRGSVSDQDVSETSVFSTHSTDDTEHDLLENDSYHMDPLYSNHSSSSESPYSSNISLHNSSKGNVKLSRCSLPNLTRDPAAVRQSKNKINRENKVLHSSQIKGQSATGRKSYSSLESSFKNYRQEFVSPQRQKQSYNQVPHQGHHNFVSSSNSEPKTNVPRSAKSSEERWQPKSGLPRPSRARSATRSNIRSGIPMPSMQSKKHVDDNWSEGCF